MQTHVTATFIGGLLKPDEPLSLPEHGRVQLTIEPLAEKTDSKEAWAKLKTWLLRNSLRDLGPRATRDELHERR
jgi:predicted DNA-binding antitoxin AbrB/MazE fold protein